jgi:hypothetical protein
VADQIWLVLHGCFTEDGKEGLGDGILSFTLCRHIYTYAASMLFLILCQWIVRFVPLMAI